MPNPRMKTSVRLKKTAQKNEPIHSKTNMSEREGTKFPTEGYDKSGVQGRFWPQDRLILLRSVSLRATQSGGSWKKGAKRERNKKIKTGNGKGRGE